MLSYIIGITAIALYLFDPLSNFKGRNSGSNHADRRPPLPAAITTRLPKPQLNEDLLAIDPANSTDILNCEEDGYIIHVFLREPLVIYIESFLSVSERDHLLEISEPLFRPSTTTSDGGASHISDKSIRDSEVAVLPRTEGVRCVERRARAFQGWREDVWVERLRTQRYGVDGHYGGHFDWSGNRGGWGRVSSFMGWVAGDATGGEEEEEEEAEEEEEEMYGGKVESGGTEFPLLKMGDVDGQWGREWCRFVECEVKVLAEDGEGKEMVERRRRQRGEGTVFMPKPGNAVYWENFRSDGTARGFEETWHLGLPVEKGTKVGLNIWSWGKID
ncbi:hypothetical protein MKZ38_006498 [Zalerion maritima]|uniref:Prolyl 4-hydroxylase alpha subunit domain-containing protein n=1 Tax=Zalerion maritima TaxID=339359 RepID=A0AAD5S6H4_9PEZI|nr:hypothetical protein MKZ38_006498 [Zalerion maritima]